MGMRDRGNIGGEEGQMKGRDEKTGGQTEDERGSLNEGQTERERGNRKKNGEKEPLGAHIIRPLPPSSAAANGRG